MPQTTTRAQDEIVAALTAQRERTLDLLSHLSDAEIEHQPDPIMSPLVWDLGHIAAYEDLWLVHRAAGEPLLRPDLAITYDAFETPRAVRGEIEILDRSEAVSYLEAVRERTLDAIDRHGVDPVLHELVLRHEMQHTETMRQSMTLAGWLPRGEPALRAVERRGLDPRRHARVGRSAPPRATASPTTTNARATAARCARSASCVTR